MGLGALKQAVPGISMFVVGLFAKPFGWSSVYEGMRSRQYDLAGQTFVRHMTGIRLGGIGGQSTTEIDLFNTLNPLELNEAAIPKVGGMTRLAMEGIEVGYEFMSNLLRSLVGK